MAKKDYPVLANVMRTAYKAVQETGTERRILFRTDGVLVLTEGYAIEKCERDGVNVYHLLTVRPSDVERDDEQGFLVRHYTHVANKLASIRL